MPTVGAIANNGLAAAPRALAQNSQALPLADVITEDAGEDLDDQQADEAQHPDTGRDATDLTGDFQLMARTVGR